VVLSNNDGCVIARSNEAKALGVEMGAPWHLCRESFRKTGVVVRSSNYTLYGDMSARVMRVLSRQASDARARRFRERALLMRRPLTVLKAALNHAFHEGRVAADEPWRKVRPFREVDSARAIHVPPFEP
jgi:impB/mucB/samB family